MRRTNRLKAWFIGITVAVTNAGAAYSAFALFGGAPVLPWLGALFAHISFAWWLNYIYIASTPRNRPMMKPHLALASIGVAMSLVAWAMGGPVIPFGVALVGLAFLLVYIFWYSHLDRTPSPLLTVGASLPGLDFHDADGATVQVSAASGAVLMMFYRGNWCPFCVAQVRELAEQYRELESRGITAFFVAPQSPKKTASLASRFDIPATFLVDTDGRMAKRLGIFHEGGLPLGMEILGYDTDTVFPTLILTDAKGTIIIADQPDNYRDRPEPKTYLAAFDAHTA